MCKNITVLICVTLFCLLGLEIATRVHDMSYGVSFFSNNRNLLRHYNKRDIIPFRTFGRKHYEFEDGNIVLVGSDYQRFPLEKHPNALRIVTFGGSTTYSGRKNKPDYPVRLSAELLKRFPYKKIEVINVGYHSYTTAHSLTLLNLDVVSWNPDIVILSHNINELLSIYWPSFVFDYSHKYSHPNYTDQNYDNPFSTTNALFQHFQSYWWIKSKFATLPLLATIKGITRKDYLHDIPKIATDVFRRNLLAFAKRARDEGIEVIFATQPHQDDQDFFDLHWGAKSYNDDVTYPLHETFVKHHRVYNEIIREVSRASGVKLFDAWVDMGSDRLLFSDNVHYSNKGFDKLVQGYADFIQSEILN